MSILGMINTLLNRIQLKKRINWLNEEKKKKEFAVKYYKRLTEQASDDLDMIELMIKGVKNEFRENQVRKDI